MSTMLDVINDGLEALGEPPTTDPDSSDTWVVRLRNAYDREIRKVFEVHTWNFALTKALLNAVDPTPDGWLYGFTKPAQCKRIVKVASSSDPTAGQIDYLDFGGRILTNSETTWLDYVDGTKIDSPGMWPEVFAGALAAQLAHKVCPITGTSTDKRDMLARDARRLMSQARLWDAQQNGAFPIPPGEYEKARWGFSRRYNG
jgi:hypothetical protein